MKKIVILFVMSIMSISAFANPSSWEREDSNYTLFVKINIGNHPVAAMEFGFDSAENLYSFDITPKVNEILSEKLKGDRCTASITVTVSVGVSRTYASATVTVENVACNKIAATITSLKEELEAALS